MNHYELIATGLESGVLDQNFYATFMRGPVVHDWEVARELILKMREPEAGVQPTPGKIYERFEKLASVWAWEIDHEARLRQQGATEKQIETAIRWLRRHPERPRPLA